MRASARLLSVFPNSILRASFLGIGIGGLLSNRRRNLFVWFPLLQLALIAAVNRLRLEVAVPSTTSLYFSSGTAQKVVVVESTMLLPLLFVVVAAFFAMVAHPMGLVLDAHPPLLGYTLNLSAT